MSRLVFTTDEGHTHSLELRPGVIRLGRRSHNDFQIDHATVSSTHCEVRLEGDSVLVRDLGSTNGTFIDGQPIREGLLQPGQTLRLGDVQMVLETTPLIVALPPLQAPKVEAPAFLADGKAACLNHPSAHATRRCQHCQRTFCETCVHHLRRVGGHYLHLCPVCSSHCEPLAGAPKRKKRSLLAILQKTLKLPFKRR
jgi:hypothetical protein